MEMTVELDEDGIPVVSSFETKAAQIMQNLQTDFELTPEQSAGFVGNLAHETGGFRHMQELKPVVPGSRGGAGWAMWTGPRRKKFEQWAKNKGLSTRSDAANYGFLKHELETSESGVLEALRKTNNPRDAALVVEKKFERSGVKNYKSRYDYADKSLSAFKKVNPDYTNFTNAAPSFTASGAANMGTSGQALGGVTPRSAIAPSIAASGTGGMGMGSSRSAGLNVGSRAPSFTASGTGGMGMGAGLTAGLALNSKGSSPAAVASASGGGNAIGALGKTFSSLAGGGSSGAEIPEFVEPKVGFGNARKRAESMQQQAMMSGADVRDIAEQYGVSLSEARAMLEAGYGG